MPRGVEFPTGPAIVRQFSRCGSDDCPSTNRPVRRSRAQSCRCPAVQEVWRITRSGPGGAGQNCGR